MKFKTVFVCQKCGYEAPKWAGKCPECGEWNSLVEEVKQQESKKAPARTRSFTDFSSEIVKLSESKAVKEPRIETHISEFDRLLGGVYVLPPYESKKTEWYKGTANAIYQNIQFLEDYDPEYVLILSGDHIYKMDYNKMLQQHKETGADATIAVLDVPSVTVEAVQAGQVVIKSGKETEIIRFPTSLREDLLRYGAESGRTSGMIFTQKNGSPLARTQISLYIQKLAEAARVPAEKGNIRALRQLYKTTISGIEANFDLLVRQAYERQLETEQLSVGWE